MIDIKKIKKQRENEPRESLRCVDAEVEYIKNTPYEICPKQQADFIKF